MEIPFLCISDIFCANTQLLSWEKATGKPVSTTQSLLLNVVIFICTPFVFKPKVCEIQYRPIWFGGLMLKQSV